MTTSATRLLPGILPEENIDHRLEFMPFAVRRALDWVGKRLSLKAWRTLPIASRHQLIELGAAPHVDTSAVVAALASATPTPDEIPTDNTLVDLPFPDTLTSHWPSSVTHSHWEQLGVVERFALRHWAKRNAEHLILKLLHRTSMADPTFPQPSKLTHIDDEGAASMVSTAQKQKTLRRAVASARVKMLSTTAALARDASGPKGEVLATARIAGIMAAKNTPQLIPLCHGINVTRVDIKFDLDVPSGVLTVRAEAEAFDRTGVEMEAMTAASVAALTVYDMLKGTERGIAITDLVLLEKSGGRSGHYVRSES